MGKLKFQRAPKGLGTKYLAIDLDAEGILVVSGSTSGGQPRVDNVHAWLPGQEHGPPALTPENARQLGEQLRERLKAAGLPSLPALVSVGRDKIILKELKYPPVDAAEEAAIVRFQVLKEITESPDEIVLDYAPITDAVADPAGERRAMAVVVRKEIFGAIADMVEAAGLKLAAITPRPYAAAAGLAHALAIHQAPALPHPDAASAVVTVGPQGGEFTVVRLGKVLFTRAIPAPVLINDALFLAEVKRNLTTFNGQNQSQPVEAVYVPEGENVLGGWSSKLEDGLSAPVHTFDPVAGLGEPLPLKLRGRFAGAVGLLAGRAAGLPINFAAPRQAETKSDPKKQLILYAGIAALVLIFGGGLTGYLVLSAADAAVRKKMDDKRELEDQIAALDVEHKRLEAAEQWEARSVNLLDELFEMSDRMPAGDTLRVTKIAGAAIRVDKAGKQEGQLFFTLSVGGKNPNAAADLMTAIDRDNTKDRKYYVGIRRTVVGTDTHTNLYNQLATIDIPKVYHRAPNEYTRYPVFYPPRHGAVPVMAPEAPKEDKMVEEPVDDGM